MEYLLTWVEGDEVGYRLLNGVDLNKLRIPIERPCSLAEIKSGKVIDNVEAFLKAKKSDV